MRFLKKTPLSRFRHCGLDPQSPCSLQGIPHCFRNDGGALFAAGAGLKPAPASAGMTKKIIVQKKKLS